MTIRQNSFIAGEMFSRKQMDQMGLPIGNPQLPPFNRREMPFAALTAAFAGVAAASGVMATTLAVVNAVAVVAMYAGAAMTITGMITGDKSLMKMGAIVGLAGGVGSLAAGGIASLAAGGEFAMGTAGIQSANAANAAAQNAANIAANGVASTVGSTASNTLNNFTGQAARDAALNTANMSPIAQAPVNQISSALGQTGGGMLPQSGLIGKTAAGELLTSTQALNAGGSGAALANNSTGYFGKLMDSMTPKDWIIAGGTAVSTGAKAVASNSANATAQQKYEYDRALKKQQIANLNDVPTLANGTLANSGLLNVKKDLSVAV
jgi:hypothetical protein